MSKKLNSLTKEKADMNARQAMEKANLDKKIADAEEQKRREREREKAKEKRGETSYDSYVRDTKNYKDPMSEEKMTISELIVALEKLLNETRGQYGKN